MAWVDDTENVGVRMDRIQMLAGYRLMIESRAIDDACVELLSRHVPVPNYHGARGQEALYAGVGLALEHPDYLLYNYRAFATLIAKGITIDELVNDLLMTAGGTSHGHGGIMHVSAPDRGIVGRNGVFGSKFGIALGLAQEVVLRQRDATVVCMFGEAEGNRGGLYEALNVAALRKLPIVFIAENNGYAVAAETSLLYASGDMSGLIRGFPMPVSKIDGNDLELVENEVRSMCMRARGGAGPSFVECVTYRLDPHHADDDDTKYRDSAALEAGWEKEPIARFERRLRQSGITDSELVIEGQLATKRVQTAVEHALVSNRATLDDVFAHVYFEDVKGTQR